MSEKRPNKMNIRVHNRSLILKTIRDKKVARKDLAKILNLTPAAVTNIVKELIFEGILIETGEQEVNVKVGRKKTFVVINKDFKYIFGVNIEAEEIQVSLTNIYKEIIESRSISIIDTDPIWVINEISSCINSIINDRNLKRNKILGVGVAIIGLVDSANGISKQAFGLWDKEVNLRDILSDQLQIEVVVDNNIRALALAEIEQEDYRKDLAFVRYGKGIGASLIIDNNIYSGNTFNALELGHTIVEYDGELCKCGQRGCLETVASYNAILRKLCDTFDESSVLLKECNGDQTNINPLNILNSYIDDDSNVKVVVDKSINYFALGLVNLIKLLDTKTVVLYSDFFKYESFYQLLRSKVSHYSENYSFRLRRSALNDDKCTGAVSIARKVLLLDTGGQKIGGVING